jgi:transcriptional regulator with XRE-family HTH domain
LAPDPEYVREYAALEEEFALVSEIIKARAAAGLTQAELAKRMKTTQGAIARLESGSSMPSTRTLKRFAAATGHKLKIRFEPFQCLSIGLPMATAACCQRGQP